MSGVFVASLIAFIVPPPAAAAGPPSPPAKPNIVMVMSDDQTMDTLRSMPFLTSKPGGHWIEFTNAFDNTPLCCPTRATILTGLYPHHHGVQGNSGGNFNDDSTLATWLQSAGYRTGLSGKYLNDYPFGAPFIPPGWNDWFANLGTGSYYNYQMYDNGITRSYGSAAADYHTDVVAARADSFIRSSSGQPFFLLTTPIAPHAPSIAPPRYVNAPVTITRAPSFNEADVSDKPAWVQSRPVMTKAQTTTMDKDRTKAHRATMALDDLVRTIYTALSETGKLDNTVLVFQTDNGFLFGEHRVNGKQCVYEECVRTPLFVRFPWSAGGTDSRLISSIDMAPTFADLAGILPPDPVDGRSFAPLLRGESSSWRPSLLLEYAATTNPPPFYAVRNDAWKYVELSTGEKELYDEINDPYELQNVANQPAYAELQSALAGELFALRTAPPHMVLPSLSVDDVSVAESGDATFTITLSPPSGGPVTVAYATEDGTATNPEDYAAMSGVLQFAAGETSKSVTVPVVDDPELESDETFALLLSSPVASEIRDGTGLATIADDDAPPALAIGDVTVVEGDAGATEALFTVTVSPPSGQAVTASFATADGTAIAPEDYQAASGVVAFDPGETSKTISVLVNGDEIVEDEETFTVELSVVVGAVLADATGKASILADDVPLLASIGDATVTEGNSGTSSATFAVTIAPAPSQPVAVSWSTTSGTAVAPQDYIASSGTLTFAQGESSKSITVQVVGDSFYESQEAFSVDLTSADVSFTDAQGAGTITNDDVPPAISIGDVTVNEGTGASTIATFVVTLSAPSGVAASFSYATVNGTAKSPGDYEFASGSMTFAPGETTKTIQVTIVGDTTLERAENFFVNLTNALDVTFADASGKCTIVSDE